MEQWLNFLIKKSDSSLKPGLLVKRMERVDVLLDKGEIKNQINITAERERGPGCQGLPVYRC